MIWVTVAGLFISVGFLAFKAQKRRGFKPFWTGLSGSLLIITGKYMYEQPLLFYTGMVLLIGASFWNSWPRTKQTTISIQA